MLTLSLLLSPCLTHLLHLLSLCLLLSPLCSRALPDDGDKVLVSQFTLSRFIFVWTLHRPCCSCHLSRSPSFVQPKGASPSFQTIHRHARSEEQSQCRRQCQWKGKQGGGSAHDGDGPSQEQGKIVFWLYQCMQPVRNALAVARSNFSRAHPKAKIPLKKSLSIDAFVGNDEGGPPGDYHLRGVVHHIGGTASSGHYTTCAKRTLPSDRTGVDGGKERSSAYTLRVGAKSIWSMLRAWRRTRGIVTWLYTN